MSSAIYEQIEVVKVSAGMTSATGNPVVAVNLVRKKAEFTDFTGSFFTAGGNYNTGLVNLDIANFINASKSVRGRLLVDLNTEDSFREVGEHKSNLIFATSEVDLGDRAWL